MGFLFSGIFWGAILILLGLTLILKVLFHVDIPLFRIIFAFILIYLGVRLLVGSSLFGKCNSGNAVFRDTKVSTEFLSNDYDVVFGKANIDASGPLKNQSGEILKLDVVFGGAQIKISRDVPTIIKASSVFGNVQFPDGSNVSFGDGIYKNAAFSDTTAYRRLEVDVVFGGVEVKEK
jgi:predicted membrane protein